jgi:hypothetical protein
MHRHCPVFPDPDTLLPSGLTLNSRILILLSLACVVTGAEKPRAGEAPETIVDRYCAASRGQDHLLQGTSMEVEIAAAIPKLKKQGKLHALRHITALGRVIYERPRFEGDGTVKKQVINRYLQAETEALEAPQISMSVTPDNYKFKYKGRSELEGRAVHLFEVTPKHKRQGLFKGQIWIDAATYLRVQESGYLVKSPSIFVKRVDFLRKYAIVDGISVPVQEMSTVDTRLGVGRAELTVDFSNFATDEAPEFAGNH